MDASLQFSTINLFLTLNGKLWNTRLLRGKESPRTLKAFKKEAGGPWKEEGKDVAGFPETLYVLQGLAEV